MGIIRWHAVGDGALAFIEKGDVFTRVDPDVKHVEGVYRVVSEYLSDERTAYSNGLPLDRAYPLYYIGLADGVEFWDVNIAARHVARQIEGNAETQESEVFHVRETPPTMWSHVTYPKGLYRQLFPETAAELDALEGNE